MTYANIDGTKIAENLKRELADDLRSLSDQGVHVGLATVVVGADYGARAYQRRLARLATQLRVRHRVVELPADTTSAQLQDVIATLNGDPLTSGILVLRPLPAHLDEAAVFRAIDPLKDVEAVHPENAGLLALGTPRYVPSTAASVFHVLDSWLAEAEEDNAAFYRRALIVVVGRSNNVGKPLVSLAYSREAAVASVDRWASTTGRLGWHTRRADVLVVAAGVPLLIKSEHIRQGAVVLDVGINPVVDPATGSTHMVGDVDFASVAPRSRAITPVPGGVGPVTDVWLLGNTAAAARNLHRHEVSDGR